MNGRRAKSRGIISFTAAHKSDEYYRSDRWLKTVFEFQEKRAPKGSLYSNQDHVVSQDLTVSGPRPVPQTFCYADLFHGGIAMPNSDLLPSLLFKINQNQLALEAAIMELTLWVEQHGSAEVADNVRGALDTISKNEDFINMTLAGHMTPE